MGSRDVAAIVVALVLAPIAGGGSALGDERPRKSSAVQAPAQGGAGVEPVAGAPPAIEPSLESRPARATLAPGPRPARADVAKASLRAVSVAQGEATLEIDGQREVARPGSQVGGDTVKSVEPGRLVLERPAKPGQPGGPALVIVTFDEAGRSKTRVFWTTDPEAPRPVEVQQP
jgi:hypothetical protein